MHTWRNCHLFCSLALVLPKYSEHFIQAQLGNDLKQAICEYLASRHAEWWDLCWALTSNSHLFFELYCWVFPLALDYSLLSAATATPLYFAAQISKNPTVLFFCSVTCWSVDLHSHSNYPTSFSTRIPSPDITSFDLAWIWHFYLSLFPSYGIHPA